MLCQNCGAQNELNSQLCGSCGTRLQIAATAEINTNLNFTQPNTIIYGGFGKRLVAHFIDLFIIFVPLGIVTTILGPVILSKIAIDKENFKSLFLLFPLSILVVSWLYYALMESSSKQATLGKMALGIIVSDLDGNRISIGRATVRFLIKYLLFFFQTSIRTIGSLAMLIGFGMAGFTKKQQALHDIIAKTLVIKK